MCELLVKMKAAHRVGCPIVAIETADPTATIESLKELSPDSPCYVFDIIRGFSPLNEAACADTSGLNGSCVGNAMEAFKKVEMAPNESVIFFRMADRLMNVPPVIQQINLLRDVCKGAGKLIVLLGADMGSMPEELRHDVISFGSEMPDELALRAIVDEIVASASDVYDGFTVENKDAIIDSIRGLTAFEAEQVVAISVDAESKTINVDMCQDHKSKMIEQTVGLSVVSKGIKFDDLAGLSQVKHDMRSLMSGPIRPKCVVVLEEVERTGLGHTQDLSGTNSDAMAVLLTYLEDRNAYGTILVGTPGAGKSAICNAMSAEFDCIVLRLDLGACLGSLVGQSQANLRSALRTIDSIGNENILFVSTSNSIDGLDSAWKSRFTTTFYFDIATEEQKARCWEIHMKSFGLSGKSPVDAGFSGRNIQRTCLQAYSRGMTLDEASRFVVPEIIQSAEEIKQLRNQAVGRYLSTEYPGPYRIDAGGNGKVKAKRRMNQ